MKGAAVVPIPATVVFDGEALSHMLQRHAVTEMLFTPSLLENLLNTMSETVLKQRLASLQTIFLNGEVVSVALRARCYSILPHVRFINLYSISECHEVGAVDLKDVDLQLSTKFCPIGKPCSVSPVYILDEDQKPVAEGDAGELYVGGDMLAIGYLNLPELTKTRFVSDPFVATASQHTDAPPPRMYRTGDRARILPNGQLEILGRCDFMVKIRGYSVVLGAVEAALLETVSLLSCVVVADGEETEDKYLVAYLVRAEKNDSDTRLTNWSVDTRTGFCPEIRRAVDGALPHYMIPSVFIEVETLPVSAVGAKLDRKALQAQSADRRAMLRSLQLSPETHSTAVVGPQDTIAPARWKRIAKYLRVPPGSPAEDVHDAMATLWEIVLGREPGMLSDNSDFHENGGHSLSGARLVSLVNNVFSTKISAVRLMQGVTAGELSRLVIDSWKTTHTETLTNDVKLAVAADDKCDSSTNDSKALTAKDEAIIQQVLQDAILPKDFVPKMGSQVRGLRDCKTIFLTGSTGFLGAHVLAELLRKYRTASVMCLVRSPNKDAVRKNLESYKLWDESVNFSSRIIIIKGDLSQPKLGMAQDTFLHAISSVDAIVHCGAAVSLTAPYSVLKPANVSGTLEILRVACACKAGTPFVYVSSNGIFPRDKGSDEIFLENDDVACLPRRLGASDGYGLSKWAAEQLVIATHKRGLPTLTIRFGNVGWQSTTGIGNKLDFQSMIINGSRRLGFRPHVQGWKFEVSPVDFAASSLVALADKPSHLVAGAIFHCTQSEFMDADHVFKIVAEVDGFSLPVVSFQEWAKKVESAFSEDPELAALHAFTIGLPEGGNYLSENAVLDGSKIDAALAKLDPPLTRLSASKVTQYYRIFLWANRIIPLSLPSVLTTKPLAVNPSVSGKAVGPLAGKVAVCTGASSGIGRAIVLALAEAGCHVAMGARRLEELENTHKEVANACPGSAVKTLSVRTDVTDRQDVENLVKTAEVAFGPVDILVNCAGVMYFTLMKNVMWDQWDAQVDINCKGTMYGIGAVLPSMLQRGAGHIVNITSDAGRKSFPGLGVYSGTKYFVEAMSQALRAETSSSGLRVTCIQPGNVETSLLSMSTDSEGLKKYGKPSGAKVLEPSDIGRAVIYALTQPEWCAVNEVLVEPREEPA